MSTRHSLGLSSCFALLLSTSVGCEATEEGHDAGASMPEFDASALPVAWRPFQEIGGEAPKDTDHFKSVAIGSSYDCAVREDGRLQCWWDANPRLSLGESFDPPTDGEYESVVTNGTSFCAIGVSHELVCWGELEDAPEGEFAQVSLGVGYGCAVRADGQAACWGETAPEAETCGVGSSCGQSTPPDDEFTRVSAANFHTCGIRTDGSVTCWGDGACGACTPFKGDNLEPGYTDCCQSVAPEGMFTDLAVSTQLSCGIGVDGDVQCWGREHDAQGLSAPMDVDTDEVFIMLAASSDVFCRLDAEGRVQCAAVGPDAAAQWFERPADQAYRWIGLSPRGNRLCAIDEDSALRCWCSLLPDAEPCVPQRAQ